jgi:blue copper oxidase
MKPIFMMIACLTLTQAISQTTIICPPVITGTTFDLEIQSGNTVFYEGYNTNTIGINQSYLGPILMVNKGDSISLNVSNELDELSTMHWHGLHIPPTMDGGPHQMIAPQTTWSPSFKIRDQAGTYWFHPHPHMATLKQVTMGAAGVMIVRDEEEAQLNLPRTYAVDDFPILLTSVDFTDDKQIDWASMDINTALVNGVINGVLQAPAQVIRLRLVNASNHLSYFFGFEDATPFHVIASDAGLLEAPVSKTKLLISAGERYEILVDLTTLQGQSLQAMSFGSDIPTGYPGSSDMMGMSMSALDDLDYNLFSIEVQTPSENAVTSIPNTLLPVNPWSTVGTSTRTFTLTGDGMMNMNFAINGEAYDMEIINETVELNAIEIWNINNQSMIGHPFHIHGNSFYITQWNGASPPEEMQGRKDVVLIPPQMGNVKVVIKFEDFADSEHPYMYHCHILDHEDMGMMGQYVVASANPVVENSKASLAIYPSLVTEYLYVSNFTSHQSPLTLKIYTSFGQLVHEQSMPEQPNHQVDMSALSPGFYTVLTQIGGQQIQFQFIKI